MVRYHVIARYAVACAFLAFAGDQSQSLAESPTKTIHVHRDCDRGVSYTVDGMKSPTKDLTLELETALKSHGRGLRVNVIGHKGTTVEDLVDVRALAGKVGLETVRLYWVADTERKMIEVRMDGPVFPTTSTPP